MARPGHIPQAEYLAKKRAAGVDPMAEVPGCCNAKRANQQARCRMLPEPGRTRCKFHGGRTTGPKTPEGKDKVRRNGLKHGLYGQTLRAAMTPEEQRLWDEMDGSTDLGADIDHARHMIARYTGIQAAAKDIAENQNQAAADEFIRRSLGGSDRSIASLVIEATQMLRRLALAQNHMHPGKKAEGNLKFKVELSLRAKDAGDAVPDVPDLVAHDAEAEAQVEEEQSDPEIDAETSPFGEDP